MLTPDTFAYLMSTRHLPHRKGYPLRRRMTIAERIVGAARGERPAATDARMTHLVRGAGMTDVYRALRG